MHLLDYFELNPNFLLRLLSKINLIKANVDIAKVKLNHIQSTNFLPLYL